jgi:hypothetical protein
MCTTRYIQRKPCTYVVSRLTLSPNRLKWASTQPKSPRCTIGCAQNVFHARGTFNANCAPILHRDQYYLQTNWNELPFDQRHIEVPSGVPEKISMPVVRSALTMYLPCFENNTICKWTKSVSMPLVHSAQTMHLSSAEINIISKRTETSFHLTHHLGVPLSVPKMIPCPRYNRRKACTYVVLRLTQSPNGLK